MTLIIVIIIIKKPHNIKPLKDEKQHNYEKYSLRKDSSKNLMSFGMSSTESKNMSGATMNGF